MDQVKVTRVEGFHGHWQDANLRWVLLVLTSLKDYTVADSNSRWSLELLSYSIGRPGWIQLAAENQEHLKGTAMDDPFDNAI